MSKLTDIADVQRQVELARNDFSSQKPYALSTSTSTDGDSAGTAVDIAERKKELARNDYSASNPYGMDKL